MSVLREFYYDIKPLLPLRLRMAMRRSLARIQRKDSKGRWPISETAGIPPQGWPGWPEGKRFALVLTHDVEGSKGLAKCSALMQLEKKLGFRSSFNFVPEGSYRVPRELLNHFVENGFEVGVHDLHHNGKLYRSKARFDAAAPRINKYLREWNAVGFRSGFMHRNLEWLHALDVEYDMSTFDTDPFEPQPDGVNTIFPFLIENGGSKTYAELPYTLPQDSTLFLLLKENSIAIWKKKLDWIAERGGMALLNVHPDYVSFNGTCSNEFPAAMYEELLKYVRERYDGSVCYLLPRDVAAFLKNHATSNSYGSQVFIRTTGFAA